MEKSIIHFRTVDWQHVEMVEPLREYSSDTINYIEAHFEFNHGWRNCDRLYCSWSVGDVVEFTDVPENDVVVIPQKLLKLVGTLQMNLVAQDHKDHDRTNLVTCRNTSYPIDVLKTRRAKVQP